MILRKFSMLAAHKTTHRQIETRRAILALIVTVREKIDHVIVRSGLPQNMHKRAVYLRVASAASLVSRTIFIPHAGQNEPMLNKFCTRFVAGKPCNRTDRAGNKKKAVRVMKVLIFRKIFC